MSQFALVRINPKAHMPTDPAKAVRLWDCFLDTVHEMLEAGVLMDAQMYADETGGYLIASEQSHEKAFESMAWAFPFVLFEPHEIKPLKKSEELTANGATTAARLIPM